MILSPLEQFSMLPIAFLSLTNELDISLTNSFFMLTMGLRILFLSFDYIGLTRRGGKMVIPSRWQTCLEITYDVILGLVINTIQGSGSKKYFGLVYSLFFYILIANVTGMVTYSFTSTSHLSFTLGLSMIVFLGYHYIAFRKHNLKFLELYFPAGVSLNLAPLIIPIELLARCSQVISLSVRLFANMMAGHTLLKVIGGFSWGMLHGGFLACLGHFATLAVLALLILLELGVAFIQAYVFAVLTSIYLNDAENLH